MKLNSPINIELLTFFKTGKFDYLKLGQTKKWILNNFPDPEGYAFGDSCLNSPIWFYGWLELHFDKDRLFLIYCDHLKNLDESDFLSIDTWVLSSRKKLTLSFIQSSLNKENVDYKIIHDKNVTDHIRLSIISSNVQLTFVGLDRNQNAINDPNKYLLSAFSLFANLDKL